MDHTTEKFRTAGGILAPIGALGTFGISAALSTTYTWPTEPFSVIGGTATLAGTLFNAGLVATGLVALPFATRLWTDSSRTEGLLYAVVGLAFAGAGLFPMSGGSVAHEIFGAGIFFGITLLLSAAGISEWRSGHRRRGLTTVALASITVAVWLPYDFGLTRAQIGLGAAELVVVLCFGVWSALTASRLRKRTADSTVEKRVDGRVGN